MAWQVLQSGIKLHNVAFLCKITAPATMITHFTLDIHNDMF